MNYDIKIYIGSKSISESLIAGVINVRHAENESSLMDFTLKTQAGVQDINQYTRKSVRIDVVSDSGVYRLFTGKIDYPVIDLIQKTINFQCSSNRKKLINELDVSMIGTRSSAIFNDVETPAEELEQRLKTTPKTLDFDAFNTHTLSDINPKVTPDFTLQDNDIFYRKPSVSVVPSSEIVNNINVNFDYRYTRLRHRERRFKIGTASFCDVNNNLGSFMNVKKALENVDGSGWNIDPDSIGFDPLPPSGWYTCLPYASFLWLNINDPGEWVLAVYYTAAYRFAQTVVESYSVDVKAPQSITQYGDKDGFLTHSLDIDFDAGDWEKNDTYYSPEDLTEDTNDYYLDESGTSAEYQDAIKTALNMARTQILRSHRRNTVEFETFLFPTLELKHTLKVDTGKVVATGKVTSINHTIDISKRYGSTATTISFSTAQGSQTEDMITAPGRISAPVLGVDYLEPLVIEDTESDIVTPAIDNLSRNTQTVTGTNTYNIEIPDSALTVTL